MIIIRLNGGLGNIMFQYATGKHLSIKNNTNLKFDIESYKTNPLGDYGFALEKFNIKIKDNIASNKEINYFKKYKRKNGKKWYIYNKLFADSEKYIQEKHFHFDPSVLKTTNNSYLDGWWQTEKYFIEIREILLKDFKVSDLIDEQNITTSKKIRDTESVSIHIRRCDYIINPKTKSWHGSLSQRYYENAIKIIQKNTKNPSFFIFSDDIPWVKENMYLNAEATYVSWNKKEPHNDIHLMSLCKHNIIANSTLGWWGAWLNNNKNKIVIAPQKWFANAPKNNTKDLIPEKWTTIPSNFE